MAGAPQQGGGDQRRIDIIVVTLCGGNRSVRVGAIRRETGSGWAAFVAAWTTGIAYLTATVYYQAATWSLHPASSFSWISGLLLVFAITVIGLRVWARRGRRRIGAIDWAEQ